MKGSKTLKQLGRTTYQVFHHDTWKKVEKMYDGVSRSQAFKIADALTGSWLRETRYYCQGCSTFKTTQPL